jgi:hypothetical protein
MSLRNMPTVKLPLQSWRRLWVAAVIVIFSCAVPLISAPTAENSRSGRWTGFLIDLTCARERKDKEPSLGEEHTKKCMRMPVCDRSGFGILTDTNQLLRLDEDGNRRVRRLLQRTKRESKLYCVVWGRRSNDILNVSRIEMTGR